MFEVVAYKGNILFIYLLVVAYKGWDNWKNFIYFKFIRNMIVAYNQKYVNFSKIFSRIFFTPTFFHIPIIATNDNIHSHSPPKNNLPNSMFLM